MRALSKLFAASDVIELGAGKGCYADALQRVVPQTAGEGRIHVRAFDGAPNVEAETGGLVRTTDLTTPVREPPADWVLVSSRPRASSTPHPP